MHATAVGVAQQEEQEEGIDEPDLFDGLVLCLAALPCGLFNRLLGADDAPLGALRGTRGEAGAGMGVGSSASGATTGAASASETPSRWARALRERAGASPRGRRAASSPGSRTWLPWWAWLWPMPNRRPGTTCSASVFRETKRKNSRSSGVGRGQCLFTLNGRAVRGFPSRHHTAMCAWNAVAKGGTSG
jgi:hypothetical protein